MQKAQNVANRFIYLINSGIIRKSILPNSAYNYTGEFEKKDLELYKRFVNTSAFDEFRRYEVRQYDGDEQ